MKKKLWFFILIGSILLLCSCQITKNTNYSNMEIAVNSNLEEKINDIWAEIQYENGQRCLEIITKVSGYLYDNVPELLNYDKYISEKSNGKAYLTVLPCTELEEVIKIDGTNMGGYYMVYVGEQWEDHRANWDWFAVSEDMDNILWVDIVEINYYTLEEWRASSSYRHFE